MTEVEAANPDLFIFIYPAVSDATSAGDMMNKDFSSYLEAYGVDDEHL